MTATTTTIDFSSTSLPGVTGAPTPATFTATTSNGPQYTIGAVLTESDTTVTAFQVPGTTGLLVVDGTTLTWRQQGITLSDGDVISAGFNGLQDQTTTAELGPITVASSGTGSGTTSTRLTLQTINPFASTTKSLTVIHGTHTSTGPTSSASGGSAASAASAASSTGAGAPTCTLGAGKAVALLGALGGMVAFGF